MAQVDPYDPVSAILGTDGALWSSFNLAPGAPQKIAPADSQRLYLLVFPFSSDLFVAPWPEALSLGWRGNNGPNDSTILIHQASYGPLVSGDWYAWSGGGGLIRVIDCRTKE